MTGCSHTGLYVPRVPNKPATPGRHVRVPDELWFAAKRVAADRGETVTAVILRALTRYVRAHPLDEPENNDDG
jgi:hypothetical protein